MNMKVPLEKAIKNENWCIVEGKYDFGGSDFEDEKLSYKIRPLSFEKIDENSFSENNEAARLLKIGDLYLLIAEIVNLIKKQFDPFVIRYSLLLKDNLNREYTPDYDRVFDAMDCYSLADFMYDYLKKRKLHFLTNSDMCHGFPPNLPVKGGIIFLLPKDYMGTYYLSASKDNVSFKDGNIYEERDEYDLISDQGWIYVLVNPSMPQNLVKIGMTTRNPKIRVKELSAKTAVPTPFQTIFKKEVANCEFVEKHIHNKLAKYRYQPNKEFFKLPPDKLIPFLEKVCSNFPVKKPPTPEKMQKRRRIEEIKDEIKRLQDDLAKLEGTTG